ncbi:MAG TPA: D-2-hydroxyacid dehydrogenase [Vicinamibacteria bacterium]|nr:D-2-hydroxyacid dehydrogenase [Vicinamibacteria bacterium]
MSAPLVVWVLARPDDPGLRLLAPPPAGVRFVVGWEPDAFEGAPAPDALLDCWAGPTRVVAAVRKAPGLRWIHARSAGLDRVLVPEVLAHPAAVTNGRGAFSPALAEFVLAALLFFAKDLRRLVAQQAAGAWEAFDAERLEGRTVGIVGYGDIGRAVAARLRPLGVEILALRRRPERSARDPLLKESFPPERLVELMARADDVVVAMPLTPETHVFVGRDAIAAMKRSAVLVNVGRGPVVDERALVEALEQDRIRGAALDVFESEPLPAESPLWRLPNVLLSPHCADHVPGWVDEAMRVFLRQLERFRQGEPLRDVVDKLRGY